MRLLVTRPEPDATALKAQLVALGHEVMIEPLLALSFDDAEAIDLDGAQALIATSRNAIRALQAQPDAFELAKELRVFAVGPGTAAAARAAGLSDVVAGKGGVGELAPLITDQAEVNGGPLVYLAGEVRTGDLGAELRRLGFHVIEPVVYAMREAEAFTPALLDRFWDEEVDGVILLSPRTAKVYTWLLRRHAVADRVAEVRHYCLSAAVARQLAPLGEVQTRLAREPNLQQILALVAADGSQFG